MALTVAVAVGGVAPGTLVASLVGLWTDALLYKRAALALPGRVFAFVEAFGEDARPRAEGREGFAQGARRALYGCFELFPEPRTSLWHKMLAAATTGMSGKKVISASDKRNKLMCIAKVCRNIAERLVDLYSDCQSHTSKHAMSGVIRCNVTPPTLSLYKLAHQDISVGPV